MTSRSPRIRAPHKIAYENVRTVRRNVQDGQPSDAAKSPLGRKITDEGVVLLGVLKAIETRLRKSAEGTAGAEESTSEGAMPLWFLAETERDIFLWRRGKSIADRCEFEFWVDVPALIAKRREQLSRPHGLNPYINPLWGSAPLDHTLVNREDRYLDDIEGWSETFLPHAHALSQASTSVMSELSPEAKNKEHVILPCGLPLRPQATTHY